MRKREVWIGHDPRQPLSYNVMRYSVERHASRPVHVNGLFLKQLPISRRGVTEFTYSRFLVPHLMDYEGIGIFCDEDQVVVGDIWELFSHVSKLGDDWDVAVVKDQDRFEWPSVMAFNAKNCKALTPDYVDDENNRLFDFAWTEEERIADLPVEWNHCVGMKEPRDAKLYHYTQGIPYWLECRGLPEDEHWFEAFEEMVKSVEWIDLHRGTKHFKPVLSRYLKKYGLKIPQ